jgi:hypothetical protein
LIAQKVQIPHFIPQFTERFFDHYVLASFVGSLNTPTNGLLFKMPSAWWESTLNNRWDKLPNTFVYKRLKVIRNILHDK